MHFNEEIDFRINRYPSDVWTSILITLGLNSLALRAIGFQLRSVLVLIFTRKLLKARYVFYLNLLVADFLKVTFLASPYLVYSNYLFLIFGDDCETFVYCSVFLRYVTWFTLAVLACLKFRQVLKYNRTGDLTWTFVCLVSFLIWAISFILTWLGWFFRAYLTSRDFSNGVLWFNPDPMTNGKMYAYFSTAIIVLVMIFIVVISVITHSTRQIDYEGTAKDNSGVKFVPMMILFISCNIPLMAQQVKYVQTAEILFDSNGFIVISFILSHLPAFWNQFLLFLTDEETRKLTILKIFYLICHPLESVSSSPFPPTPPVRDPPTGCLRKLYKMCAVKPCAINNDPAEGTGMSLLGSPQSPSQGVPAASSEPTQDVVAASSEPTQDVFAASSGPTQDVVAEIHAEPTTSTT